MLVCSAVPTGALLHDSRPLPGAPRTPTSVGPGRRGGGELFMASSAAPNALHALVARQLEALERQQRAVADPVLFARESLNVDLWARQAEIARLVAAHGKVAVRSGHKIGKSRLAATIAFWWALTRRQGRVVVTATTGQQVKSIIWREMREVARGARITLPPVPKDPSTGVQWDDGRFIVGISTDEAERMAGFSGDELLFIVDEASGVADDIFEAIEGNRAGGARLLMLGNPTRTTGVFFEAFNSKREFWQRVHVSSEETPNVVEGRTVVRGLANRDWVEEKRRDWGEDSPLYAVRVRGNFPDQASNAVVGVAAVDAALERWAETPDEGRLSLGVDVARFGDDDSVIAPRRGQRIAPLVAVHGMDTVEVAERVLAVARDERRPGEPIPRAKVDDSGVGGGVVDILRRHRDVLEVVAVNASSASTSPDEFFNLRSQLHFGVAEWLAGGGALPPDQRLEGELVAPTYSFDARGRRKVEPKDEIKKRLPDGRSPDRADAVALAIFEGATIPIRPPRPRPSAYRMGAGRGTL